MRNKCIICDGNLFEQPLSEYENLPASAQNLPTKEEILDEEKITLNLCQCTLCGLVQFDCNPVSYYKKVIRSGGFTSTMVELRRKQYKEFIERFNLYGKKVVEVGAGRGEFLSILDEFDVKAYGIEYSKELVSIAQKNGLNINQGFIGSAEDKILEGPFDGFLSFNFLEHQPNPNGMLQGIYNNLTDEGVGLITVPSLEYIIENESFYEFIRDHIAYYSKETFEFLLKKNGFEIVSINIVNRDTWAAFVRKRTRLDMTALKNNFNVLKESIHKYIEKFKKENKNVAVWGASHQGFTIVSMLDIGEKISYIIDSAPFKQGKYAPGSHVPIVSPEYYFEEEVGAIIIIAPGYTDEISSIIREKYGLSVEVCTLKSKGLEKIEFIN